MHTHPNHDQSTAEHGARPAVHGREEPERTVSAVIRVEPATVEWLEALVEGDDVFAAKFGIAAIDGWAGFPEAVPHILAGARERPDQTWGAHLFFDNDGALVGLGGWKGAPVRGGAELGYAVAPARQGRGIATAVVGELLARAVAAGVTTVVAHTLPEPNSSTAVLERCGFTRAAEAIDLDEGPVWRWERPVP